MQQPPTQHQLAPPLPPPGASPLPAIDRASATPWIAPTPTLRLRPELPVCWEDPETLRIGFDRAVARVVNPTPGQQRLIGRLIGGFPAEQLTEQARAVGATKRMTRALLEALAPALESDLGAQLGSALKSELGSGLGSALGSGLGSALESATGSHDPPDAAHPAGGVPSASSAQASAQRKEAARATAHPSTEPELAPFPIPARISTGARPLPRLSGALTGSGICSFETSQPPELVVYVERFLEPLERAQTWLMAGLPHLLIRFTDTSLIVGPLVVPPGAPCHTCATLAVLDQDPALPVIAAQLVETAPASETDVVSGYAAAAATELILSWWRGELDAQETQVTFPVSGGRVVGWAVSRTVSQHPECACGLLGETGGGSAAA